VKTIADLQGMKIRTGGGVAEAVGNAIGAVAFVKPAPESFELLKAGVADGTFFPIEAFISFKLETVVGQVTEIPGGMYSSSFGFFMNEDKWNKLDKADRAAIERLSREHVARTAGKSWDGADAKAREAIKKAGVPLVKASPALVADIRKRSDPIIEDWIAKANAKGVDAPKVLAAFRAELKNVAAGK
jgi:TRAP-type C4-dicarboxylate transport system substrate-binding protein